MTRRPGSHSPPDIWFFQMLNKSVCLWQQAIIEITRSLLSSPLEGTINCSLASQALLKVTRLDHSIGITLLLLVCATYTWVLFFTHIPFVVNRTVNATPTERLQHHFRHWHAYKQNVWQILQAWRNLSTFTSQLIALKSKLKFCHTVPSPREGAFVGLVPPKQVSSPPNWNIRHYKTVMFVQILVCQAPLHKCKAPPTEDFLVTVLLVRQAFH